MNNDLRLTINNFRSNVLRQSASVILLSLIVIAVPGCKSPSDSVRDASGGGPTGSFGTGNLVVFSNELKTGGGAFEYPNGDNQILSFNDTSNPISARSIRYNWNGQSVNGQTGFAGFDLCFVPVVDNNFTHYNNDTPRDLRAAGYNHVTFYARGNFASNEFIKVEVADDGDGGAIPPCVALSPNGDLDDTAGLPCGTLASIGTAWGSHTITITNSHLNPLKDFFKATFVCLNTGNIPCGSSTVYFDNIVYTP
jgi:hypothetical protein